MREVYVDNNATTPVAPEVVEAMLPFFGEFFGNPASIHRFGARAVIHCRAAREQVSAFLGANPEEIVFTSCGTESNNAAIRGTLDCFPDKRHIVTTAVEHPAVRNLCAHLSDRGYAVTELSVDEQGHLNIAELEDSLRDDTALVSIMYANNETGVLFPIEKIAPIVKTRGIILHCDAVQAAGKVALDLSALPVDLLSLSGHKLHAPKGIGVLYARKGTPLSPLLVGGHQERGLRAGTENVPYIVGLAKACELAGKSLDTERTTVGPLRDRLEEGILSAISHCLINGDRENRLSNTSNISFEGIDGESAILFLNEFGIASSSGAACMSGVDTPSPVLRAMGVPASAIYGSIRFSLSRYNTGEDIDYILECLPPIIAKLREFSPGRPPRDP
ncbi:MAG: cysteine desulfurase NifS [Deltaproteobacteria bacterium]|nr:cysteine desulfurase NifS [Deltaproteobacteria bacterium]